MSDFLRRAGRRLDDDQPLIRNRRGERLTRHGARYLLLKYVRQASRSMPTLQRKGISPHTMRHSKGMHLLQSGVPLVTIKDFLGHADLKSTEVYVQIDLTMKREALNLVGSSTRKAKGHQRPSDNLLHWLESL